ncbi:MAG TPA: hypothetical protein VM677_26815 [Actinokineospora sp.]|nr:hypothetical protein [Actinokineospora sp.]
MSAAFEVPAGAALDAPAGVSGAAGWAFFAPQGEVVRVNVSDELDRRWQAAYRAYEHASAEVARSGADDRGAAHAMAVTSWDVAVLWREIADSPYLPWWVLAAVHSAAETFEHQSREWNARSNAGAGVHPMAPRRRGGGG